MSHAFDLVSFDSIALDGCAACLDGSVPEVLHQLTQVLLERAALALLLREGSAKLLARLLVDDELLPQLTLDRRRRVALPVGPDGELRQLAFCLLRALPRERDLLSEPVELRFELAGPAALAVELGLGPRERLRQRVDFCRQQRELAGEVPVGGHRRREVSRAFKLATRC